MSLRDMKFGDTVPEKCPKCDSRDFYFLGYGRVTDTNQWRCSECGYTHHENAMDRRRKKIT